MLFVSARLCEQTVFTHSIMFGLDSRVGHTWSRGSVKPESRQWEAGVEDNWERVGGRKAHKVARVAASTTLPRLVANSYTCIILVLTRVCIGINRLYESHAMVCDEVLISVLY